MDSPWNYRTLRSPKNTASLGTDFSGMHWTIEPIHLGVVWSCHPMMNMIWAGTRYILTISDYFTKFGWAKSLPTKEAVHVVAALRKLGSPKSCDSFSISCTSASYLLLFFLMGLPSVLTTDQGKKFRNQLNHQWWRWDWPHKVHP